MFKCPNCSGSLYFDINLQKLKCKHCESVFSLENYHLDNNAKEEIQDDMTIYTCQNCGAQLVSADSAAVAFCSYCDSQQILESKLSKYDKPYKLIPFKVTKKQCKDIYKKEIKKAFYAPKEFRDEQFVDKFRGIYIPYWNYGVKYNNSPLKMKGTAYYTRGDYVYNETYDLSAELQGVYDGVFYDASSNFDDTIAESISPFKEKDFVNYDDGYLAGFYADVADVPSSQYEDEVKANSSKEAISSIRKEYSSKNIDVSLPSNKIQEYLGTEIEKTNTYLFPVWFLTWRKKDRVAYAVVNGQTGQISSDLPIDSMRFLGISVLCALALFAILTIFVTMTAPTALFISSLIAFVVARVYRKEIMNIHDRENHIFDRGYFVEGRDSEISLEKAKKILKFRKLKLSVLGRIVLIAIFVLIAIIYLFDYTGIIMPVETAAVCCTLLIIPAIWNFIRTLSFVRRMKQKSLIFEALTCFVSIIIAWVVLVMQPAEDIYYYGASLICLAGVLITCFGLINKYNILATRSVPELFDRKGANDNEKD